MKSETLFLLVIFALAAVLATLMASLPGALAASTVTRVSESYTRLGTTIATTPGVRIETDMPYTVTHALGDTVGTESFTTFAYPTRSVGAPVTRVVDTVVTESRTV